MSTTLDIGLTFGIPDAEGRMFPVKGHHDGVPTKMAEYVFRSDLVKKALFWLSGQGGRSIYLTGPAGSGKTSLPEQMAARLAWPCATLSCNGRVERADVVGYLGLKDGGTAFIDGPLTRAMRDGHIMILDEGDSLPPSVTLVLNRVLEGGPLLIPETGETVSPHSDFRVAFTGNTRGRGDTTGTYRARQVQDAAVLDRFLFVEVDYPTQEEELSILAKKYANLPKEIAEILVNLAKETRAAYQGGELGAPISTRGLVRIAATLISGIFAKAANPILEAINFAYGDGLGPEERDGVRKLLETVSA